MFGEARDGSRGVELLAGRGLELLTNGPGHPQPVGHGVAIKRFFSFFVRVELNTGHGDGGSGHDGVDAGASAD